VTTSPPATGVIAKRTTFILLYATPTTASSDAMQSTSVRCRSDRYGKLPAADLDALVAYMVSLK
jgi:hypothetical protein